MKLSTFTIHQQRFIWKAVVKAASQFVLPELNTAKSSHQKALSDTIIQDSAQYIVVQQDTQLPSDVKSTLSKTIKSPVKGVERYTVYVLK